MIANRPDKATEALTSRLMALRMALADGQSLRLHRPARRRAPERIPAARGRAAGLADRLHRLGRHGDRARRRGGDLRRRPLHAAGARAGRHGRASTPEHLIDDAADQMAGGAPQGRRPHRLRPVADDAWPSVRRFAETCRGGRAPNWSRSRKTRSTASVARPPGAAARRRHAAARSNFAGEAAADKIARLQEALAGKKADAAVLAQADSIAWTLQHPRRRRRPQPGAAGLRHPAGERPADAVHRRPQALQHACATRSPSLPTSTRRRRWPRDSRTLGAAGARVLLDPQTTPEAIAEAIRAAGGTHRRGQRPGCLPKARKNATELAGAPPRPRARRRRDGPLPRLARPGGAGGRASTRSPPPSKLAAFRAETARRDGSELIDISFDTISGAGPNGAIVHYRVTPATSADARAGHALPGRFRRPVPRRHHRHHPHRRRSARRRPRCATASPGCSRAISPRHGALPGRHHRRPARHAGPPRAVAGRARLRPRHRPRRRLVPVGPRGPGAHLQARHRGAGAGHDPLQRARLLQGRRLRHPHREPGGGRRRRRRSPAASATDARLRDADAGARSTGG